jgi:hypothetical protein
MAAGSPAGKMKRRPVKLAISLRICYRGLSEADASCIRINKEMGILPLLSRCRASRALLQERTEDLAGERRLSPKKGRT